MLRWVRRLPLLVGGSLLLATIAAQSCDPNARVFFMRPFNGASVRSPFVVMALLVNPANVPSGLPCFLGLSIFSTHFLSPFAGFEGISEILCVVCNLCSVELHYAHVVEGFSIVC
jgi:hypothetical protein